MVLGLAVSGCFSIPHLIWPQQDIAAFELHHPSLPGKVLVASRNSPFKGALVQRICDALDDDSVYVKGIGIPQLRREKPESYSAVVLINSCMSWSMDRHVKRFLKNHTNHSNIIVLTTSATGEWLPRKKKRTFDALCSASEQTALGPLADGIAAKINVLLGR